MLPLIPQDKANHFVYGALIGLLTLAVVSLFDAAQLVQIATPTVMSLVAGVAKEYRDKRANQKAVAAGLIPVHGVELADAIWTTSGGLLVTLAKLF